MSAPRLLERTLAWISPGWGASRARSATQLESHRLQLDALRAYEAASRQKRMDGWHSSRTSANGETEMSLPILRDRHRQLVRDNPYAARAVGVIEANVGFLTPAFTGDHAEEAEELWKAWAGTTDCDAGGQHDFDGLQAMVMRATVESGESLVRRRHRRLSDGLSVPLQLQLLESDFLDSSAGMVQGKHLIQGVEFDRLGRRIKYHLFRTHPGDPGFTDLRSSPVAATEIAHIYRQDRPGQVRGIPWGAPVMVRIKGFDEYEDAHLMRQKIAACFSVLLTDVQGDPSADRTGFTDTISPGTIKRMGPGEGVEFASPPGVDGYGEYSVEQKHAIATGYGIPYAAMTGDRRQVNFSSGKMAEIDFARNLTNWRRRILQQQLCQRAWAWFQDAALLKGYDFREVKVTWTAPQRALLDLAREVPGIIKALDRGVFTLAEVHRGLHGRSSDDVVQEIKDSNASLDKAGLGGLQVGVPKTS